MSYCDATDVQALVSPGRAYSASTTPTSTQVALYIGWVAAELDSILAAQGITTPVTTPANAVTALESWNAIGAAAYAEEAAFTQAAPNTSQRGGIWRQKYEEVKKQLREHPGELVNALVTKIIYDFPSETDGEIEIFDETTQF